MAQARRLVDGLSIIVNDALRVALDATDGHRIATCARLIGAAYQESIEWAQTVRRTYFDEVWREAVAEMALFTGDVIDQLEALPEQLRRVTAQAGEGIRPGETRTAAVTLSLDLRNLDGFKAALAKLQRDEAS